MKLQLKWNVTPDAPAGTEDALKLLLKSGSMLTDVDRDSLELFLRQRLEDARRSEGPAALRDKMLEVLDYRGWFRFRIEYKAANSSWKPLTRKAHAAGSGGQKAVMLHMPLFAAAAAFFSSAGPNSPRLIVLDEAFAGIDAGMRAHLMSLLVTFDLDFVMTSYEEWGFYQELDGLSTYHLARDPAFRGVYTDWFVWNGRDEQEMGN